MLLQRNNCETKAICRNFVILITIVNPDLNFKRCFSVTVCSKHVKRKQKVCLQSQKKVMQKQNKKQTASAVLNIAAQQKAVSNILVQTM